MRSALWRATRTLRVSRATCQPLSVVCGANKQSRRHLHHSQMSGPRGAFIVLEGTDRSGKSTQCARLVTSLNAAGVPAELWRFPDRTTSVGHMLDAYLRGTPEGDADDAAVHLLFSANRWEKRTRLLEALQSGTTLVVDRYAYSGVAFTSAKRVQGLDLEWCKAPDAGLPAPDAVLLLRLSPEVAALRGEFGQERYEKVDFQAQVARQFELMREPWWTDIDAAQTQDEVAARVLAAAQDAVQKARGGQPLRTLW